MSVSLEALAMAGEDYDYFGMEMEEWERAELEETPAYLLADDEDDEQLCSNSISNVNYSIINDGDYTNYDIMENYEEATHFEAFRGCEASRGSCLTLRGLVMVIAAMIKLMMLIRVNSI